MRDGCCEIGTVDVCRALPRGVIRLRYLILLSGDRVVSKWIRAGEGLTNIWRLLRRERRAVIRDVLCVGRGFGMLDCVNALYFNAKTIYCGPLCGLSCRTRAGRGGGIYVVCSDRTNSERYGVNERQINKSIATHIGLLDAWP